MKINKLFALLLMLSIVFAGCNPKDGPAPNPEPPTTLTDEELFSLPYSALTPEEQKSKLGLEGEKMIDMMKDLKNPCTDAVQYLGELLNKSGIELSSSVEDVLNMADVNGIYTWNKEKQAWDVAVSTNELKIIFPSTKTSATNDAELIVKSTDSGETYEIDDVTIKLPASVNASLLIKGTECTKFSMNAEYDNSGKTPNKVDIGANMRYNNSGKTSKASAVIPEYVYSLTLDKNDKTKLSSTLTNNNTVLYSAKFDTDMKLDDIFDAILDEEIAEEALKDANMVIHAMDNVSFVGKVDTKKFNSAMNAADELSTPDWDDADRFTAAGNAKRKAKSEAYAKASNDNMQLVLAARKDATKIANVITRSVVTLSTEYWIWNSQYLYWEYDETQNPANKFITESYEEHYTLQFNDKTEVDAEVYFSEGFTQLNQKWNDFLKTFDN